MCNADKLSKNRLVIQELENELSSKYQTNIQTHASTGSLSESFGAEVYLNNSMIPKEVLALLQDQAFIQNLYYDDDLTSSESMESVVGLLQSAIEQIKELKGDTEEEDTEDNEEVQDVEMTDKKTPRKEQSQSHMLPNKDTRADSMAQLVEQLQNALDELNS